MNKRLGTSLLAAAAGVAVGALLVFLIPGEAPQDGPPDLGEALAAYETVDPTPAPEISFSDAAGNTLSLDDFAGEVVVLNFWATWCAPCVREMPALDRLQAAFADAPVTVMALSVDRGGAEDVEPFYAQHGIEHLGIFLDPDFSAPPTFSVASLPTTVVLDPEGRIVGRLSGPAEWDSEDAEALVRHYLPGT
jgi:thiol-disulfide isomerase/thioredoxin